MNEETYQAERRQLLDYLLNQAGFFDRGILTLSAAALGLSLTFTKDIAATPNLETLWMLFWSWACFIVSLLATLASFQTSQRAIEKAIENLDTVYECSASRDQISNPWRSVTIVVNWISLGVFIVGAALLAQFAVANFAKG